MNQLQLSEMVFALNTRIQPNDAGSPISRFFRGDVRGSLPNSLNRNLNRCFFDGKKEENFIKKGLKRRGVALKSLMLLVRKS